MAVSNLAEITYDMTSSPQVTRGTYSPLRYSDGPPPASQVNKIVIAVLRKYKPQPNTHLPQSVRQWKKVPPFCVNWTDAKGHTQSSVLLTFDKLAKDVQEHRKLRCNELNLPPLQCQWLDPSVIIRQRFAAPANPPHSGCMTIQVPTSLGNNFPVVAGIDREGIAISSLQHHLAHSILRSRDRMVLKSHTMLEGGDDWLDSLTQYLSNSVAIIENVLHQVYYKAKYDGAAMKWKFDETVLGQTHRRPLQEKVRWIHDIVGKGVGNAEDEMRAVLRLKDVRNHFAHFDPPTLALTIEDATEWLNAVHDVAGLLWKIRDAIGSPLSGPLIEMLLAPTVHLAPFDPGKRRPAQPKDSGYSSCQWPDSK